MDTAATTLRRILNELPDDVPTTRKLISGMLESAEDESLKMDGVVAATIAAILGLERQIRDLEAKLPTSS